MNDPETHAKAVQQDAKDVVDTARYGAGKAAADAATHVRNAADDISETAELTFEQLKEQVMTLKADVAKLATSAGEAGYEYVGNHVGGAMTRAETFTRERPAAALGIAASAGFVFAHILMSRRAAS